MRPEGYLVTSLVTAGLIYPVIAHWRITLRNIQYCATKHSVLCYETSSTETAYPGMGLSVSSTDIAYGTRQCAVLKYSVWCYATSSTEPAYGATRMQVWGSGWLSARGDAQHTLGHYTLDPRP
eukprot:3941778-Rhodomonas_salina.1